MKYLILSTIFFFLLTGRPLKAQQQEITGKIYNMQGPRASSWDFLVNKERYLHDTSTHKDIVNFTTKKDLPEFKKTWGSKNSTTFLKTDLDYNKAELKSIQAIFDTTKASNIITNIKQGDLYLARVRGKEVYALIKITAILDDGKTIMHKGGHNNDYISFTYKFFVDPSENNQFLTDEQLYNKAMDAFKKGNYTVAVNCLNYAVQKNTHNPEYFYIKGISNLELEDFSAADRDFSKTIILDESRTNAYVKRGSARNGKGDYENAIKDFTLVISRDSSSAEAWAGRGHSNFKLNKNSEAIADFTQAIQLEPNNFEHYFKRGLANYEHDLLEAAIKDFSKVEEIYPEYNQAYFQRGLSQSKLGKYHFAEEDFTKVILLDPQDKESLYNRAMARRALENYQEAIYDYNKIITIDPDYEEAYYELARTRESMKDIEGAIFDFSRFIEKKPQDPKAYVTRGNYILKLSKRKAKHAIPDFDKAIELEPGNSNYYLYRGLAKKNARDPKGACEDWQKALEMGQPKAAELLEKNKCK